MSEIKYTSIATDEDFKQILKLQECNLFNTLTSEEKKEYGYLTVQHNFDLLKEMWESEPGIIAKDGDKLAAYIMAMTRNYASSIPLLIPLFDEFKKIIFNSKAISSYNYVVVGQVCVDKEYRSSGVFGNAYAAFRTLLADRYDFAVTEIATKNLRSLSAHKRVGFQEVGKYVSPTGEEWSVVIWKW